MMTKSLTLFFVSLFLLSALTGASAFQRLNPYAPPNATPAEPPTPYNLWEIPRISRVAYEPCPGCGYASTLLPDLPPMSEPLRGPFGIPVPVP
jgi:hypothetical protein